MNGKPKIGDYIIWVKHRGVLCYGRVVNITKSNNLVVDRLRFDNSPLWSTIVKTSAFVIVEKLKVRPRL